MATPARSKGGVLKERSNHPDAADAPRPAKLTCECPACGLSTRESYSDVLGRHYFLCTCSEAWIEYTLSDGSRIGMEHWSRYFS